VKRAMLFGPYVGSLNFELYRFAPYAIFLKKQNPATKLIVFTRPERLDLYGRFVDIFVTLRLDGDSESQQKGFSSFLFSDDAYKLLVNAISRKYISQYNKFDHYYPETTQIMRNVRWQFPKDKMDYDFSPRLQNKKVINSVVDESDFILSDFNIDPIDGIVSCLEVEERFLKTGIDSSKASKLGCLIELIKKCKLFIGDISSTSTRLALLLKKPVVTTEDVTGDAISLLNPFRCPVVKCDDIEMGVNFYNENYI
jgi:hypothetical protein